MTGLLFPQIGNNANLVGKLIPHLLSAGHEVQLLSDAFDVPERLLPNQVFGITVHWVTGSKTRSGKLYHVAVARMKHDPGYAGEVGAGLVVDAAAALYKQFRYDLVFATMQPYHMALAASRLDKVKRAVYLMDPPDDVIEQLPWKAGQRQLMSALRNMDSIYTTPFIREAIEKDDRYQLADKMVTVNFPHIGENELHVCRNDVAFDSKKINLLYCGALFADVRSPDCFLKVVELLDERFTVTFMGRNCLESWKEYSVCTKACVRVLPPQPYDVALNAMHSADVLINIGNNMRVHMPSKMLDYINTGKPIINFHKFKDCPTLYYTNRYPLCLNLYEQELVQADAAELLIRFCEKQKGNIVSHAEIERLYSDCRAETIANIIMRDISSKGKGREHR